MSWVAVGIGGAGLVTSVMGANQKAKQEKAGMLANAEAMKYSPWTGMNTQMQTAQSEDPALAGLKGGLAGAMTGATFGQQFAKAPTPVTGTQGPLLKFK